MRRFSAAVLAYAASKAVFALFDFQYSIFGDPFSAGQLAIDLGVFVVLFAGFDWLLRHLGPFKSKDDASYAVMKGYAPGWVIRCTKCGAMRDGAACGMIRIGGVSIGKRTVGWCGACRGLRILAIEKVRPAETTTTR